MKRRQPERAEQRILAQYLDALNVLWCHPANEGMHKPQYRHAQALAGLKPGVPDCLIFTPPPTNPSARGLAIELKAVDGRLSDAQSEWIDKLSALGWVTAVAYGADDAIGIVRSYGYESRRAA
jgi:hypothetical protein